MKYLLIAILCVLFCACATTKQVDWPSKPIRYPSPTAHYKRDSSYIIATVWEFIDKKVDIFDFYKRYHIPLNKVNIDVDTIFYSPDSLKLIAFAIEHLPDHVVTNYYYYSGSEMIGYRQSTHEPWKIRYWGQYRPTGFENYNKLKAYFRDYYFGKFKTDGEYIWDPSKKNMVLARFGYNLNDPLFCANSIVWRKGARIPGYYNFETTGNVRPGDEHPIKIIPPLNYPDSLLKLYR
jgi:hypothetical protein